MTIERFVLLAQIYKLKAQLVMLILLSNTVNKTAKIIEILRK